jgi:hypothetical protein
VAGYPTRIRCGYYYNVGMPNKAACAYTESVVESAEVEAQRILDTVWKELAGDNVIPVDPILLAYELGAEVFDADLDRSISGMIRKKVGQDPQIYLNRSDSPNRSRFSCAHELGHLIYNSGDDNKFEFVDHRGPISATGKSPQEVFANQFAAALLMPRDEVVRRYKDGRRAAEMAWEFKVSIDAMQFRIINLELE